MADVFVSYARADKARVAPLVAIIEAAGWSVWWDPEIDAGQDFDRQISTELGAASVVLVIWTPSSVESRWVRGEAREAAERGVLVPARFEKANPPIDLRALHTTDLDDWGGDGRSAQSQQLLKALGAMLARDPAAPRAASVPARTSSVAPESPAKPNRISICVLPFVNMSGDAEQEYFSDGISEDIITDLSKVSALAVISRNSAFMYKRSSVDVLKVARELKVSHVLEGSVRKSGGRVRITAQLIDGLTNDHLWAERYDRDLNDIFALQDEISEAIVKALKIRLLPAERKAIEQRGTDSVDAYNLYLMAKQTYVNSYEGDDRSAKAIVRLAQRATEIDPGYARAWALLALGQQKLQQVLGGVDENGLAAANRALELDQNLAEAHAIKSEILAEAGHVEAAAEAIDTALRIDPESWEVNRFAGRQNYRRHRPEDAIPYYEKALTLMETDIKSPAMLISCYAATGDTASMHRAARLTQARAEKALQQDSNNCSFLEYVAYALSALGEFERAKERMARALLIDPDNINMRYNFATALSLHLGEKDAALDMLAPVMRVVAPGFMGYVMADPDLDPLRDDPRFKAMVAEARQRFAGAAKPAG